MSIASINMEFSQYMVEENKGEELALCPSSPGGMKLEGGDLVYFRINIMTSIR